MRLDLFKTLWGHAGSVQEAATLAVDAGFVGLEAPAPADDAAVEQLQATLTEHRLDYIAEICTTGSYVPDRHATPEDHLVSLEQKLQRSKRLNPRFCNVMGGCDAWPLDVQIDFFRRAKDLADRCGIICSFETHRGRSFFNPWVTRDVLRALPDLRITCDFSHWVVVCERLMDAEWETILEVAEQAHHVHSRVGYDQGPQVPHPAAPEYAVALESHERCWQAIWASQSKRNYASSTMTPEFGPDGYLHTQPFTSMPVADLWQVNRWIGLRERDQFEVWRAARKESAGASA
ncbi:Sugar phosphate isomerase/epimerase [Halopseudomonas sabulinigri]|uniref:Sugar phosphate isomerase/epimerase n=1 Tax=Halopseudomonas sabulinigri TaxID=472181 RepID=A0A1H1VL96_9GAMM|nr:TIM barrel protein [Halopseudomonas sabulinigri]SDS85684.1 Sugar phosphate isomerase/epimerase [Halopseudomonas sabulinigri]